MEKRAVIVGVNRYQDDQITNLDWAVSDAIRMQNALDDCGFSRTRLLTSEMSSITVDNHTIEHSVRELREGLGPEDLLVLYFAGHGYQDAEWGHLLLPANVVYEDLNSVKSYRRVKAALRVSDLEELMGAQGAGRLILLDACRTSVESANRDLDSGMSPMTARDLELVVEKAADRHGASQERGPVGIICGCSENQKSYELKDKGGVFTHGLIADLKATREAGEAYRFPTRFESIQERMNQLMASENRSWKQQPFCKVEGGVIELLAGKGEDLLAEELRKKEEEEKEKARQAAEAVALEEERQRREEAERLARAEELERKKQEEAERIARAKVEREREIQESARKQKEVEEAERRAKAKAEEEERKRQEEAARKAKVGEPEPGDSKTQSSKGIGVLVGLIAVIILAFAVVKLIPGNKEDDSDAPEVNGGSSALKENTAKTSSESENIDPVLPVRSNFTIPELELEMVWINPKDKEDGGTFWMGSPESEVGRYRSETRHQVTLTEGYWLGKYEVTQGQWQAVMDNNPSWFTDQGLNAPVEQVSWEEVQKFCEELNKVEQKAGRLPEGYKYALPTEAQWEYACRAGTTTIYYWGDSSEDSVMKKYCWYEKNADDGYWSAPHADQQGTQPVGSKLSNAWGLYDMSGNVFEWCEDWYESYPSESVTNPVGPASGDNRVIRGGSWINDAKFCRSADRNRRTPSYRNYFVGFRLALRSTEK